MPSTLPVAYAALLLSVVMSVALYHLIDGPIDSWRQARLRKNEGTMAVGRLLPSV